MKKKYRDTVCPHCGCAIIPKNTLKEHVKNCASNLIDYYEKKLSDQIDKEVFETMQNMQKV